MPMTSPASEDSPDAQEEKPAPLSTRQAKLLAVVGGLVAVVAAVLTPLMPVHTTDATIGWPQGQTLNADDPSIVAPLIAQSAQNLDVVIPCRALAALPAEPTTVLATMPAKATRFNSGALVISANADRVAVTFRSSTAATATRQQIASSECTRLHVFAGPSGAGAQFVGLGPGTTLDPDKRPQIDGLFTSLTTDQVTDLAGQGLRASIAVDNRYETSPTVLKILVMAIAVLATLIALFALYCLDRSGGYRGPPVLRLRTAVRAVRMRATDAVVTAILIVWLFLGAGAPDDGYILNMGRVADDAGYLPNYYRFYGVSEAPFDWYYNFLALWSKVSPSLLWMHIPALVAGLISWFVISRVMLPRLGSALAANRWANWAAAAVFLSFWMPFCSGLRTEGVIVLGSLLTWWAAEKAITSKQLLPAALAATAAALTLSLAPQGVVGVAILLVSARALLRVLLERRRTDGLLPLLAPIAAAGLVVLVVVFRDQTLMTVLEAMKVKYQTGPTIPWHQEFLRYYFLSVPTPDGAIARRIPVVLLFAAAVVTAAMQLRRGRIEGVSRNPVWRLVGALCVSLLLFFFVPMKWTIHFGVFAGLGAALAATGTLAVAQAASRSSRNLTVFAAGLLFALAASMSGRNAWPYGYRFGVPWFDKAPVIAGQEISSLLLILAVLTSALALWQTLRLDYVRNRGMAHHGSGEPDSVADRRRLALASSPIAVIAALMVLVMLGSLAKGAISQRPAMSVASNNLATLTGSTCAMADEVLVEDDPNAGMLVPADGRSASAALAGTDAVGFTPNGIANDLTPTSRVSSRPGQMHVAGSTSRPFATSGTLGAGTTGGTGPKTVNGSTVALPFGLDPDTTPVLGSFGYQGNAHLTTGWYQLPDRSASPLIVFATAGPISTIDADGVRVPGQKLVAEFGRAGADGGFEQIGPRVVPIDPGPVIANLPWRNLRVPMSAVPAGATVMRLVADDTNLGALQFIGLTPPRAPRLQTLQAVVGSDSPTLIDFPVAAHFPCQQPIGVRHGVVEVPQWRILPDYVTMNMQSKTWMAASGGGLLAVSEGTTKATTVPTYLKDDWHEDWGSLEKLTPLAPQAAPARVQTHTATVSGLSRNGSIRVERTK